MGKSAHQRITEQQAAFFTRNGYIELEGLDFHHDQVFFSAHAALKEQEIGSIKNTFGRDLWRQAPDLQMFALRQLSPALFGFERNVIRLACDQWIFAGRHLNKACPMKDLFSIQGLVLGAILCSSDVPFPSHRRIDVGIPPFPKAKDNVLFMRPHILLDWPLLAKLPPVDLYFIAYARAAAVYVHNPKDPSTHTLKQLGYEFGDTLRDPLHPRIRNE